MEKPTLRTLLDSTEAGEEITKATLIWHYNFMKEDNDKILNEDLVSPHKMQDYCHNEKYMEAIRTTLTIFGVRL